MNRIRTKYKAEFFLKSAGLKYDEVEVSEEEVIIRVDTKKTVRKRKCFKKKTIEKVLELFDFYMIDISSVTIREEGIVEVCIKTSSVFFSDDFELDIDEVIKISPFRYKKTRNRKII